MWCYRSLPIWLNLLQCGVTGQPSSISFSVTDRSSLTNLCQCDVTDQPSSIYVSVRLRITHHQSLSLWCYRSPIISLCQCDVTDHPSSVSVSVMLQISHHQSSIYVSVMDQTNTKASNNSKNKPEKTRTFQFYFLPGVTLFTAVSWPRNVERELFTSAFRDLWAILDPPQERRRKQKQQLHAFDNYTHYAQPTIHK